MSVRMFQEEINILFIHCIKADDLLQCGQASSDLFRPEQNEEKMEKTCILSAWTGALTFFLQTSWISGLQIQTGIYEGSQASELHHCLSMNLQPAESQSCTS